MVGQNTAYVEVREFDTGKTVKRLGPMSDRDAERVQRGIDANLNHERFYTQFVIAHDAENARRASQ